MAGVIDPDYRGEIIVLIHNFGDKEQIIKPKQRTAQLILERAELPAVAVIVCWTFRIECQKRLMLVSGRECFHGFRVMHS